MAGGTFITFEGGDGSGKTTLIRSLMDRLERNGREVVVTREPGGSPIAEAIREVILHVDNTAMDPLTEALLYAASRRQHLAEKVLPALARGAVVVCDRFVDSSLVYQGYARGLGIDSVWEINRFATEGRMPDLTLYLDLDPQIGLSRIEASGRRQPDRLDLEGLDFHTRVREGYRQVAAMFPERIVMLDASGDPGPLKEQVWKLVSARLESR
ncbi:dTMP kinase [Cohnella pontilimi]|uniref:Thymidylate kinase n=1 Tax=Cohnella pontilimi TaxID=2564100 RepID=A0A4U0F298_9BACL|nr:dTMP kinase [Cohnella pontilimi]TJY38596.1 dTMP kinase [Cohnella pontilimi]